MNEQEAVQQVAPATEPKPETAKITTIVKAIQIKKPAKKAATVKGKGKKAVKQSTKAAKKTAKKAKTVKTIKATKRGKYPRHAKNPFRDGSAYATAFDIMAAYPKGLPKEKLIELFCRETHKDKQHGQYDCAVLCSAKNNSRHQSCADGFTVERQNDFVQLIID